MKLKRTSIVYSLLLFFSLSFLLLEYHLFTKKILFYLSLVLSLSPSVFSQFDWSDKTCTLPYFYLSKKYDK
ncbi:hypothetical protein BCV71DRAFT_45022 [Rhizopus microsporus]|uniref:Uncharacterized protein n=1 Tax=Rhizopus microsporus TaxID=58291 RepID=A0A1X0SGF4_RHIZD|nr:hypothetical protein BCV71DRAFT_45022 [Rhizopus microsporus]